MDLKQELINRLGVPENWDKYDYRTQRYSFDDMQEVLEDIVKKLTIPVVSGSFSDDLQSCIDAEKENRVKRIETFVPAFEDDTICHFFWVKGSKYPLP